MPESRPRTLEHLVAMRKRAIERDGGFTLDWEHHMGGAPLVDPSHACAALGQAGIPFAVMGAIACARYQPPRTTVDVDILVGAGDLGPAGAALEAAGFEASRPIRFPNQPTWSGTAYTHETSPDVDLIGVDEPWVEEAIAEAGEWTETGGFPVLSLPALVLTKLIPQRTQDLADLSRMLGIAWKTKGDEGLATTRDFIAQHRPDLAQDLDQIILLGRWEVEPPTEYHGTCGR